MFSSVLAKLNARRFARDERGVSAVEFALLLPLMVTLYLGTVEMSQGIAIDRKVTLTARTVADLVSQVSSIDEAGVSDVLAAASAVMSPYPVGNTKVTVSVIEIDADKNVTVKWSRSLNGQARSGTVTIPDTFLVAETTLVWGEAEYLYKPSVGDALTGDILLQDQIFMRPRLSEKIPGPPPTS